ncbi:nitroreductase family protein [Desulfovibrio inopinatus]|uniref:nitroreductase family protein n=1 Tax=Desulfovibrio inopinatus TaxID=102109 RepID=UPI00041CED85|nr:nitroreductase family protein [Desulfovibrio inopinatus]
MLDFAIDREKCTKCGECARDCIFGVIVMTEDGPQLPAENEARCIACQHCLSVCKPGALSILGKNPDESLPIKKAFPSPEEMTALIEGRRSVRHYKKEPVSEDEIATLLNAAFFAPTAVNIRTGGFTVVDDPAVMESIRVVSRTRVAEILKTSGLPAGLERYENYLKSWTAENDIVFRGAPQMIIATSHKDHHAGLVDTVISLSYVELMAQSMGLGTLWCGLAKLVLTMLAPELIERLGIPEDQEIGYIMMIGKPAVKYHRAVQRNPMAVHRVTTF